MNSKTILSTAIWIWVQNSNHKCKYQDLELSYDAACATYQYRAKCCRRAYPATAVLYCY